MACSTKGDFELERLEKPFDVPLKVCKTEVFSDPDILSHWLQNSHQLSLQNIILTTGVAIVV